MHNPALAAQIAAVKAARARMGINPYSPRVFIPPPQLVEEPPPEPLHFVAHEVIPPTPIKMDPYRRVRSVIRATALHYGMTTDKLMSNRRTLVIVRPRQIAMYVCVEFTPLSLPEIGRRFGRDHTTVLNAARKIAALVAAGDANVIESVNAIVKRLGLVHEPE